jgi:hypothetical protein
LWVDFHPRSIYIGFSLHSWYVILCQLSWLLPCPYHIERFPRCLFIFSNTMVTLGSLDFF